MDGLALLCTLHADGPATLKRLRGAGCGDLEALLQRPVTDLAVTLEVAPAAARRLLREARLLAERVGLELDTEEAPEGLAATATSGPLPLALELPVSEPAASPSPALRLDGADRALLERIVRKDRPASPSAHASATDVAPAGPPLGPPIPALERVGLELAGESPSAHTEPGLDLAPPAAEVARAAAAAPAHDLGPLLALEGVDAELARDLAALGYGTVARLAEADSLSLRRDLGVTVAQAKRLGFLARRANGGAASAPALSAPLAPLARVAPSAPLARVAPAAPAAHNAPVAAPAAVAPLRTFELPRPGSWRIEPKTQPLPPAPEPPAEVAVAPLEPALPLAPARARFWEPREHLSAASAAPSAGPQAQPSTAPLEPQGVEVDPAQIARPRRFWEARRPAPPAAAPPAPQPQALASPASPTPSGGTTLGWNFELPRPGEFAAETSDDEGPRRSWRPLEVDESSAGPFA